MKWSDTHTLFARWLTISMSELRINKQFPVLPYSSQTQRANSIAECFPFAAVASFSGQSEDGAGISRCLQRRSWKLTKINNGCLLFLSVTYRRRLWPTLWTLQADRCISWDWLSKHSEACKVCSHPASAHGWCGKKLQYSESDLHETQKHSHNWTPGHAHESSSWGAQECTRVESVGGEGCGEVVVVQGQEAVQKKCFCAFY